MTVAGPFSDGKEFEAILDTGFTGLLSMPLLQAFPLGLILYGTTNVVLADGNQAFKLTARAMVKIEGESKVGLVILEPNSTELLLGMGFLRQFNRVLYVSKDEVLLVAEEELQKAIHASAGST